MTALLRTDGVVGPCYFCQKSDADHKTPFNPLRSMCTECVREGVEKKKYVIIKGCVIKPEKNPPTIFYF